MSTVSNRFYVQAIQDGSTLHGNILSDKSLTQGWSNGGAVPNWEVAANQPTIYVTLYDGNTRVSPSSGTWHYVNGASDIALTFDSTTHLSTNTGVVGTFYETTVTVDGVTCPAVKIVKNLARQGNLDNDTIRYEGTYVNASTGTTLGFTASILVRITGTFSSGMLGIIEFPGKSSFTQKGEDIQLHAVLYDADGNLVSESSYTVAWYLNEVAISRSGQSPATTKTITLNESEVVDSATVKCVFTKDTVTFSAYEVVDDEQDDDYMWIQYDSGNGSEATLHKNQSVTFHIWMATRESSTKDAGVTWTYRAKLFDAEGAIIMDTNFGSFNDPETSVSSPYYGYRLLAQTNSEGLAPFTYEMVSGKGHYISGYVLAEQVQS